MRVIAVRNLFLGIPSKTLGPLSSLPQLTKLEIWAKIKVLNTRVVATPLSCSEQSELRIVWPGGRGTRVMMIGVPTIQGSS